MNQETSGWLEWVRTERRLSPSARLVARLLVERVGVGGTIRITPAEIAPHVARSAGSVRIGLRQLKSCGMIEAKGKGGRGNKALCSREGRRHRTPILVGAEILGACTYAIRNVPIPP